MTQHPFSPTDTNLNRSNYGSSRLAAELAIDASKKLLIPPFYKSRLAAELAIGASKKLIIPPFYKSRLAAELAIYASRERMRYREGIEYMEECGVESYQTIIRGEGKS